VQARLLVPARCREARPERDAATRDPQVNLQDLPPVTGRRARQRSAAEFPVQRRPSRQTAASRPDPTRTTQMSAIGRQIVRKDRFDQNSASIGATATRFFAASASCRSSVIKASASSWVKATYSASNVSDHPS
jgi:hypothetical protein